MRKPDKVKKMDMPSTPEAKFKCHALGPKDGKCVASTRRMLSPLQPSNAMSRADIFHNLVSYCAFTIE